MARQTIKNEEQDPSRLVSF